MTRNLAILLLGTTLSGCSVFVDPDLPGPYRCEPDSALGDTQCAGGWRCAPDGFCRDPALGAATPCGTSADCLGGWYCGVAGICYDRALAGAIPCRPERDAEASDCAPEWRCPSGGICQQRGVFGPYPCESSADCEAGGHCGVQGRCYLRDLAKDVPCRQELDHDPEARDCAPSWVCSANGRCVDASVYQLRPNGPLSAAQLQAIAAGGAASVDQVATECFRASSDQCGAAVALTVARGSTLELHRVPTSGPLDPPVVVQLTGPARALATTTAPGIEPHAYSLVALDAGALHVWWPPTGVPVETPVSLPFVPERLLAPSAGHWFLAVNGPDLALVQRDTGEVLGTVRLPEPSEGGPLDYGFLSTVGVSTHLLLLTTSAQGVFASRATAGGPFQLLDGGTSAMPDWTPVRMPGTTHAACPADQGGTGTLLAIRPTTGASTGSGSFRGAHVTLVPGEEPFANQPAGYTQSIRVDLTPTPCGSVSTSVSPTCLLCPEGSALSGLHAMTGEVLCSVPLGDGGVTLARRTFGGNCDDPQVSPAPLGDAQLTAVDPGTQATWAYGGADGQVILRTGTGTFPLRLNRPPTFMGLGSTDAHAAHVGTLRYRLGDAGFQLDQVETLAFCASVRDAESYRLVSNGLAVTIHGTPAPMALANSEGVSNVCAEQPSILGEAVVLPDGGAGVVIAARDRLWSQAPFPPDAGTAWPVRLVPAHFANITSLATLRPSELSAPWGSVFVIANEQVFAARAESLNRWSSTPLLGPPGEPFQVWADPHRGRVTYRDGSTYSLPFFARLSWPLPEQEPEVRALKEICGAAYALGRTGLFRLELGGVWEAVPTLNAVSADWTRLHTVGDVLYAFTETGRAFVLVDTACARP